MKRFQTTVCLAVVLVILCGWRGYQWQRRKQSIQHGFSIALSYPCFYPESFNVLGDDRQLVAHYKANESLSLNETPYSESEFGSEMEKIFETRDYKLVWFNAAPQVTYGQAVHAIASLRSERTKAIIAVSTASQLASKAVNAHGFRVEFCPYTSHTKPS
jgi:hypothetical protein